MVRPETVEKGKCRGSARRSSLCACGLLILFALAMGPRTAFAMTADGTLLTNAATVTFYASKYYNFTTPQGIPMSDYLPGNLYLNPRYSITYLASANVLVSFPIVAACKQVDPPDQGAGGLVTYRLCIANSSSWASAFNVAITDILPDNMQYAGNFTYWDGGSGGTFDSGYYSFTGSDPWLGLSPGSYPENANITMPLYLKWTLSRLGPGRSAYAEFLARVD